MIQLTRAAGLCALVTLACAGPGDAHRARGLRYAREGKLALAVEELRLAVAREPGDRASRVALGRLEAQAGRPGAALRQLEAAALLGDRSTRKELAALLAARGRARARLAHRDRWRDLERAVELDGALAPGLREERLAALGDAGIARWAAGDPRGARAVWARIPVLLGTRGEPAELERAATGPDEAPLLSLGAAALRFWQVGGARAAAPLLDAYVRRGGDDPRVLRAAATVRRTLNPAADVSALLSRAGAGASGCVGAAAPFDDPACAGAMAPPLDDEPSASWRGWRAAAPARPELVADVLAAALAEWLYGRRDAWIDAELIAFVEREAGDVDASAFPPWARPTISRLRGDHDGARLALAAAAAGAPAYALPLVAFEEAAQGQDDGPATARLSARDAPPLHALARATLHAARGDFPGDAAAVAPLAIGGRGAGALARRLEVAPLVVIELPDRPDLARVRRGAARWRASAAAALPAGLDEVLARWRAQVEEAAVDGWLKGAGAARGAPLGAEARRSPLLAPGCEPADGELDAYANVERTLLHRPERAEGVARDFIDGADAPHCRGLAVLRLFQRAGDAQRGLRLADELLAIEPEDVAVLRLAVAIAATAGDAPKARLYLETAEYGSRARGVESTAAVGAFLDAGFPVDAIAAGRDALALADGARRWDAFEALTVAALAAGRAADARGAFDAYLRELPARLHDDARRRVAAGLARFGGPPAPTWLAAARPSRRDRALAAWVAAVPEDVDAAVAQAAYLTEHGDPSAAADLLDATNARNPWAIASRRARAEFEEPGTARRHEQMAELLLLGLVDDGERAIAALEALAALADAEGLTALAEGARREAALLRL